MANHGKIQKAESSWADFPAIGEWMSKCSVTGIATGQVINSLW